MPVIGVSSVGAGGGSVAWCDRNGVLRVGPRSAGADPGPACYDRGGEEPTVTDAFVVTGLLDPDGFSGGRLRLSRARAEAAIARLGEPLGLRAAETAEAIIAVAKAAMFVEFSALLTRKGLDPREFTLVAFGGAGPLVACSLAQECHIGQVLVPPEPGTLCALGALMADVRNDYIKTVHARLSDTRPHALERDYRSLRRQAEEWLGGEPLRLAEWRIEYTADMRYVGQAYEIQVAIYAGAQAPRAIRRQTVRADGQVFEADLYRRSELRAGHALAGPAVVEQADTTVFVPAGFGGSVDEWGNILMRRLG
jgi:N-methylhydantoinase A